MNKLQKDIFIEYEADKWFERNKIAINNYTIDKDVVVRKIQEYNINPCYILEIGCSAGYRLNGLKSIFSNSKVYGIDPSKNAINYAKSHFADIDVFIGTSDDLSVIGNIKFDLIIVGFVFYVIDKSIIYKMVSEIDKSLSDKGILIINDFFSSVPKRNAYHHIVDSEVFSYKDCYEKLFTSSNMYHLIDKSTFLHSEWNTPTIPNDFNDAMSVVVLKKDVYANYK